MFSKYKEEFMYNFFYVLLSIIFYSFSYGVEVADAKGGNAVNEKFKFIKEIYSESWALIIGINKYQNGTEITYASSFTNVRLSAVVPHSINKCLFINRLHFAQLVPDSMTSRVEIFIT